MKTKSAAAIFFITVFLLPGCAFIQKARMADELEAENIILRQRIARIRKEKAKELRMAYKEKDEELSELERAKKELEMSLKKEIGDYKAKLQMTERGLVITFLSEVFFDSGKDKIKADGKLSLDSIGNYVLTPLHKMP